MVKTSELKRFDVVEYLDSNEAIAEYLNIALEDEDPDFFLLIALGDIARAKGMMQVAKEAGLGRESLYKTLREGASPRFETIHRVLHALGIKLVATPV